MNIAIIPSAKMIGVDDVFHTFDYTIDADVHAVHWNGTTGEVEYTSKARETIDDFTPYAHLLVERTASMEAEDQKKIDDEAALETQKVLDIAAEEASLTPTFRRQMEYPKTHDQLRALYLARTGDTSAQVIIDAAIASVDLKYPL